MTSLLRLSAIAFAVFFNAAEAEPVICPTGLVTIAAPDPLANRLCTTAEQAINDMAACGLTLERPVEVRITEALPDPCLGLYHCGEDLIELLPEDSMREKLAAPGLFHALHPDDYYDSILVHELVHAAYDPVQCPYGDTCTATSEYLAYALQIQSLSEDDRALIGLADVPDKKIGHDEISAVYMALAPDRFAIKAWTHLMQRPDPCAYIGQIASGKLFFDFEHP